jgi:hypothetical protein
MVRQKRDCDILNIVGALNEPGGLAHRLNGWKENTYEDDNDRDRYEQFHERGSPTMRMLAPARDSRPAYDSSECRSGATHFPGMIEMTLEFKPCDPTGRATQRHISKIIATH